METPDTFDKTKLRTIARLIGPEAAIESFRLFMDDTERAISDITGHRMKGDRENYTTTIHSLKGNAYTFGANKLGTLAEDYEKLLKTGAMPEPLREMNIMIALQELKAVSGNINLYLL